MTCTTHHICDCQQAKMNELQTTLERMLVALSLIAAPKRADGTYNRCREACEQLANDALKKAKEVKV